MKYIYIVLFPIFVFFMFKSSGEPILQIFRHSYIEAMLHQFKNGNTIAFNLSIGYIVSFIFWFMNIYIPRYQQKQDHIESLKKDYMNFKKIVMRILLQSVLTSDDDDEIKFNDYENIMEESFPEELLVKPNNFRNFFYANKSENWYAVLNSLNFNKVYIRDLYIEFEILEKKLDLYIDNHGDKENIKNYRQFTDFVYRLRYNSNAIRPDNPSKYIGDFLIDIFDDKFKFDLIKRISS